MLLLTLSVSSATRGDDAAVLAALTGARDVKSSAEGLQMIDASGKWIRAVRTVDGGYSIFSPSGSMRLFRTQRGFGFCGPSNATRSVVVTPQGFSIYSESGVQELTKIGSAYIDRNATNNFRIVRTTDGFTAFTGPLAPTPADTAYELFLRKDPPPSMDRGQLPPATNGAFGPRR